MAANVRGEIRNLAIIAHVDHGKTSLVDAMLWQGRLYLEHDDDPDRVRRALDPDREKAIKVMVPVTSVRYRRVRIHLVNTPGHAELAGEVEQALRMVEGFVLVVDAEEGPSPQTRFALRKALEAGLVPIVVVNKIDRPEARPAEVLAEVRQMFAELEATDEQRECPVLYCNARRGTCRRTVDGEDELLGPLFDVVLETVPAPSHEPDGPLQLLVTSLDYDDFLGRLGVGRIFNGSVRAGGHVARMRTDGSRVDSTVAGIFRQEGLDRVQIDAAGPGDIVSVTGIESVRIGETLTDPERPRALPPLKVDEPTLAVVCSVNDSPMAGLEGQHVSAAKLRERLWREILTNTAIRVEETDSPDSFRICGRGELQLAILIEMLRREGYELSATRPRVLTRSVDGVLHEPVELLMVDCPEAFVAVVREKVAARSGRMTKMFNPGAGRARVEFRIPARCLVGFRSEFLNDTKGTGIMKQVFDGYEPRTGDTPCRGTGALVADRPGSATAHAIAHLQARGTMFVAPGDEVYEGMIVGENSRPNDVEVNVMKTGPRSATASHEEAVRLIPPRTMSLEQALEFIRDDELVEVTPKTLRMRKKVLQSALRARKS